MKVDRAVLRQKVGIRLKVEYEEDLDFTKEVEDAEAIAWIRAQLAAGNIWAWGDVCVEVWYGGYETQNHMGGCSYESAEAFKQCDYYESLVMEGVNDIARLMETLVNDHDLWEHDRITCIPCAAKP